jgi:hypothetical protein
MPDTRYISVQLYMGNLSNAISTRHLLLTLQLLKRPLFTAFTPAV